MHVRRYWQILALILALAAGWLYFSAPGFRVNNIDAYVWCDPLAPQIGTQVSLYSSPGERGEIVDQYVDSLLHDGQTRQASTIAQVQNNLNLRCQDARAGRQATFNGVLTISVLFVVWWRTRTVSAPPRKNLTSKER